MRQPIPGLESVARELRAWLEAVRVALGAEAAFLWVLDSDAEGLSPRLAVPEDAEPASDHVPVRGHALGWVVSEGVSLRASARDIFRDGPEGWLVAAPLSEPRGERVGCVALTFDALPRPDAPRALELAGELAGRLLGDVRNAEEAVDDLRKYEALYGALLDFDRELDLRELAAGICRRALRVTGARGAVVASWDAASRSGAILAAEGDAVRGVIGARLANESSYLGLALCNATALPRDDLTGKGKFPLYAEGLEAQAGSAIIVPMILDADPIGALAVEYERPRQFDERDYERLQALARFVAPAFRNAVEFGEVKALSLTDALTALPNRRATERVLASTIVVAERTGTPFAVAVVDIDHFKKFNDRHGHDAGDCVLQTVARTIRDGLRPGDHAGRWGGEEFLVVLPGAGLADGARVVERIRRVVEQVEIDWSGRSLCVTLSAGVSAYPEVVRRGAAAVAAADAALYRAKRSGRNTVALAEAQP